MGALAPICPFNMKVFITLFYFVSFSLFSYSFISVPGESLEHRESVIEISHKFVQFPNGAETFFSYDYYAFNIIGLGLTYTPDKEGFNYNFKLYKKLNNFPISLQAGIDIHYLNFWCQIVNNFVGLTIIKDLKNGPLISAASLKLLTTLSIGFVGEFYYIYENSIENSILKGGVIYQTYGHEFIFTVSNTTVSSITHLPQKPNYEYIYLGFSIRRKF